MGSRWQVHTAKARFSEPLDKAVSEGPRIVTREGIDTAVVVPLSQSRPGLETGVPSRRVTSALELHAEARLIFSG